MKNYKRLIGLGVFTVLLFFYAKCGERGAFAGREYMPDMAHAVSYEAQYNTYYSYNQFGTQEEYNQYALFRMPAEGTLSRGKELYDYKDTEEERARAMKEITSNPVPVTPEGLDKGKQLYLTMCGVCHGSKGDGADGIYKGGEGAYPAKPANFLDSAFVRATEGRYYHAIMYGKNVMGSYKDKLDTKERWLVIQYIRSLQGKLKTAEPATSDASKVDEKKGNS